MSAAIARMPDLVEPELLLLSGTIARSSCTLVTPLANARSTRSHQKAKGRSSEAPQTKNVAGRAARFRIGVRRVVVVESDRNRNALPALPGSDRVEQLGRRHDAVTRLQMAHLRLEQGHVDCGVYPGRVPAGVILVEPVIEDHRPDPAPGETEHHPQDGRHQASEGALQPLPGAGILSISAQNRPPYARHGQDTVALAARIAAMRGVAIA